ncbi:hypothetical protein NPIL_359241 [Nephila pilipes]|uniref:Uncharacterized protein n=1 Tax=Nephila pilipes TaxID=299642 RepID=A0A8X6U539_NEPPI|nr:hypothetical protein NPIL_359241 [Nephila pilipes]
MFPDNSDFVPKYQRLMQPTPLPKQLDIPSELLVVPALPIENIPEIPSRLNMIAKYVGDGARDLTAARPAFEGTAGTFEYQILEETRDYKRDDKV